MRQSAIHGSACAPCTASDGSDRLEVAVEDHRRGVVDLDAEGALIVVARRPQMVRPPIMTSLRLTLSALPPSASRMMFSPAPCPSGRAVFDACSL